jgi:hypothetical protein
MSSKRRGHILAFVLAVMGMIFILVTIVLQLVHTESYSAQRSYVSRQALNLAEAGIEHAIRELNNNASYPGENDVAVGNGTFSITVSGSGSTRTIEATGYVPSSLNPIHKRVVRTEASLDSSNVEFFYGIQVDGGGLTMNNNSQVVGNVYSNGSIIGGSGVTVTGDAIVAGGLDSAPALEWPTHDADNLFATASSNRDIAQSFVANETGNLAKVTVFLAKVGNPNSNLTLRIQNDNNNKPSTSSSLATSTISYANVGLTPSWIEATFTDPPSLTSGTKYWIVLDYGSNSSANHWNWRKDTTDSYAGNTGKSTGNYSSGSAVWTDVGGDLAFQVWIGGTATKIENTTVGLTGRANLFVNSTCGVSCLVENPSPQALPISEGVVQDWKNTAAAGGSHIGDYILTNGALGSLGPKKIEGNLLVDNGATLTVTGTLWVTGNITTQNNTIIKLDPGYGTNSGIIVTDGLILTSNNAQFQGAGTGSYVLLLTTRDAKNDISVTVDNNAVGVIYYAAKSKIQFKNNATAKEATAWGMELDNNAVITYDSGLANTFFTGGPGGGWQVKKGTWRLIE